MRNRKLNTKAVILGIVYAVLILPMAFSMFNSIPASDDFAFGSNTVSDNLLVNAAGYSAWNWMYHSGRWLIFFIQKIINPLNVHVHLGRAYGIYMIVLFMLIFFMMHYSLKVIFAKVIDRTKVSLDIVVCVVISILYTTYYYVEAFNWYVGATAYALPMGLLLLSIAYAIRFEDTAEKKFYVGTILAGLIPATNEFFDVPIGVLYLYVAFYMYSDNLKDRNRLINRLIPLGIFILGGISVVFAPGNFVRQAVYDIEPNVFTATKQIIIDFIFRLKDIIVYHPLAVILLFALIVFGFKSGAANERNNIVITMVVTFVVIFGMVFPYVYGRAMTTTYLDVRMQYLFDYFLLIGMSIGCIQLGRIIRTHETLQSNIFIKTGICVILILYLVFSVLMRRGYQNIVQIGILQSTDLISESYEFWDDIISEIEASKDSDVVITRESEPTWSPYFLYMGIIEEDTYDVSKDTVYDSRLIMPNVYYGKDSIRIEYTED